MHQAAVWLRPELPQLLSWDLGPAKRMCRRRPLSANRCSIVHLRPSGSGCSALHPRPLPHLLAAPQAVTNVDKGRSKKRHEVGVRLPDDPGAQEGSELVTASPLATAVHGSPVCSTTPLHTLSPALPPSPPPGAVAMAILEQLDRPLLCSTAGGEADADGGPLAPDAAVLMDRFGPQGLDFVVDAGPRTAEGSTVIDCTGGEPVVVRRGKGDTSWLEE